MTQYINYLSKKRARYGGLLLITALCLLAIQSCKKQFSTARYDSNDQVPLMEYIEKRDDLSIYAELITYVQKASLLKTAGTYTVFAPTNAAFQKLFTKLSAGGTPVTAIKDKSPEFWLNYFNYHLLDKKVNTNLFEQGALPEPTVFKERSLIADIRDSYSSIKLNNLATINESNIEFSNGFINIIDEVLSPPVESIYDELQNSGKYKVMLGIFEETGLTKYLKDSTITLIVERDEILAAQNFDKSTIENLHDWAAYHIIPDSGYFLNQLIEQRFYPVYDKYAVSFNLDNRGEYYMNNVSKFNQTPEYGIDKMSANGVYHSLDNVLAITMPVPTTIRYLLYPPGATGANAKPQNVFAVGLGLIQRDAGTNSYHLGNGQITRFNGMQVSDYFHFTIPDVPLGKYKIRLYHRAGNRAKFLSIYNGNIVKNDINLNKADGLWSQFTYLSYNDCGVIDVESNSDVKLIFALTGFHTSVVPSYCCDVLMDVVELIPEP